MKKFHTLLITALVALGCVGFSGCEKPNETQSLAIAQQAGLWASVGWIALDNPTSEQIVIVLGLMGEVETASAGVVAGQTYTETVYPALVTFIDEKVAIKYRPLAKAGVLSITTGIDLLFVSHPEWREDEEFAHAIVQAFIKGARSGLSMSESEPIMVQARKSAVIRAQVFDDR